MGKNRSVLTNRSTVTYAVLYIMHVHTHTLTVVVVVCNNPNDLGACALVVACNWCSQGVGGDFAQMVVPDG